MLLFTVLHRNQKSKNKINKYEKINLSNYVSCNFCILQQRKDVSVVSASTGKKLKRTERVYNGGTPETTDFTYDSQGRLLTESTNDYLYKYSYPGSNQIIVTKNDKTTNAIIGTTEYSVSGESRITNAIIKNPAGSVTTTIDFTYDAQGYLKGVQYTYPNGTVHYYEYTIINGNYSTKKFYAGGMLSSTTVYTVNTSQPYVEIFTQGGLFPSPTLFGKLTKNPVVEAKTTDASGNVTWHTKTNHEFDAAGYVTKQTINFVHTGTQGQQIYSYE